MVGGLVSAHHDTSLAVMVFNLNVVAAWALQQAGWLYATGRGRLVEGMVPRLVRASRVLGFLSVADFTAATATAWASP